MFWGQDPIYVELIEHQPNDRSLITFKITTNGKGFASNVWFAGVKIQELDNFIVNAKQGNRVFVNSSEQPAKVGKSQLTFDTYPNTRIYIGAGELSFTLLEGNTVRLLLDKLTKMLNDIKPKAY